MESTKKLAELIYSINFNGLTKVAIDKAKLCLLDWVGVTVGAFINRADDLDSMINSLSPFFGPPQATLITKGRKIDVFNALLINGTASHLLDYDDVHPKAMSGHPTVPVMPVAVAMGEYLKIDGRKLIEAIVSGAEAECRIGEGVNPEHYRAGWHATATLGCFGACAATAKILGLNVDKIINALGIAGTQAFGVQQAFGTMCKPFHAGKAACNGALAAILAEGSFTAPREIVEGRGGFGEVYSTKLDETKIGRSSDNFEIEGVLYKRYASCYYTHSTIGCLLEIRNNYRLGLPKIESVLVRVNPVAIKIAGNPDPKTGLEGKFSIRYCAALSLVKGMALETCFSDELVYQADIQTLMAKIAVVPDETLAEMEAEVLINVAGNQQIMNRLDMFERESKVEVSEWTSILETKCRDLLLLKFPSERVDMIVDTVADVENTDKFNTVAELLG